MQENKSDEQKPVAEPVHGSSDEEIWKSHVLAAQNFMGSAEEYCKRNGLSFYKFNEHKKKYGMTKRYQSRRRRVGSGTVEPKAFLKVECKPELSKTPFAHPATSSRARSRDPGLPDPKWMAEFVTELMALR